MTAEPNHHLRKIDFLRGIAILLVFLYHCQLALYPNYLVTDYKAGIINIHDYKTLIKNFSPTAYGWCGVTLFLIISGFLIHLGYLKNENNFKPTTFFSKRFWRIYPPYLLALFFFCFSTNGLSFYLFSKEGSPNFLLHVFSLHNLYEPTILLINPAFWSLALEIQLYLIYPVFLFIRKKAGIKNAFLFTTGLSLLSLALGIVFHLDKFVAFENSVLRLWFVWAAGAYFAEVHFNKKPILKRGAVFAIVLSFLLLIMSRYFAYTSYFSVYIATFAWILLFDWFLKAEKITVRGFAAKPIITIGLCSYSIYLIHQPFLEPMLGFFDILKTEHHNLILLKIIPAFAVVFLVAHSLYTLVELPSVQFGNKLRRRYKKKHNAL